MRFYEEKWNKNIIFIVCISREWERWSKSLRNIDFFFFFFGYKTIIWVLRWRRIEIIDLKWDFRSNKNYIYRE